MITTTVPPEGRQRLANQPVVVTKSPLEQFEALEAQVQPVPVNNETLLEMMRAKKLIPGQLYRITDFITHGDAFAAADQEQPLDIIVMATDATTISETALAMKHDGDTHFNAANVQGWQLGFTPTINTARFPDADPLWKGLVYYVKYADGTEKAVEGYEVGGGDFVSYAEAQTLTDAQKQQARENIDAISLEDIPQTFLVCSSTASTVAKKITAPDFVLVEGKTFSVRMVNVNSASNPTLDINSTGAKAIYYNGAQASSSNTWEAGEVLEVYYDGTQYQCASGGGGKFASGEKVKDTSITNEVVAGSAALPTSGAVYDNTPSNMDSGTITDLDVVDEQNNILLRLAGGGVKTKNFDSDIDAPLRSGDSGYDLEISDEQNNVLLRLAGGGIKTKNFDSDNIEPAGYAKKKVIKYLAVGNSVNQDAACYIPYLLRKLYGDDIDFEIGIAYRAAYTIKDYVQRIITGLDNLNIFSHAKNSMVLINENNKSFDYAINFSDWDIVSFQMYQSPDKTEDVSYAPMLLDYLKHNTKNGCKFGLVTPATYAGSTYRDAYIGFQQDILTSCALDFMLDYGATKEFFIINGMTVDTSTDNVHTDDGFGCEALALTAVHLLSDIYGLDDRASNIDTPVTQAENTAINVAGSNGSFQTTTDENWRKCVDAALQGWRTGCASYSLANNTLRLRTFNT